MFDDFLVAFSANSFLVAGWIAGLLSIVAYAPYIIDTARGRTQPDRACWLIWAVLASISGASNWAEGAGASLFFIAVQVGGTVAIFVMSISRGAGSYFSPANVLILMVAALGVGAWYITANAAWALSIAIAVSALGGTATILKAYRNPQSETASTWIISIIAAALGLYAVGAMDVMLLAYPAYLLMLYTGIVAAMALGAERQVKTPVIWTRHRDTRGAPPAPRIKMPPPVERPVRQAA